MPPGEPVSPPSRSSRATPRLLVVGAAALLALRVGVGIVEHLHPPKGYDRVTWIDAANFDATAAKHDKPILYDFTADWCPPCQLMKREVFADKKLARLIDDSYTPVRVLDRSREDGRNHPAIDALQRQYAVDAFPTLVVVYSSGRGTPMRQVGYPGKDETETFVQRAHYMAFVRDTTRSDTASVAAVDSATPDSQPPPRPRRGRRRPAH